MNPTKFLHLLIVASLVGCTTYGALKKYGQHYQQFRDYESLSHIVDQLPAQADTADVKRLLGEPIDFGFDYRYLIDSSGPTGCPVGAVFHIDEYGKIDQKWIGEICE
ncbi:MAG: hypothetical protein EP344_17650 [Bacteroidetes bacterium]|nr:MAG: hypothetical protein EP344_17650 [Bacteroidota bacterium]